MSNYRLHLAEQKAMEIFNEITEVMSDYDVGSSEELFESVPHWIILESYGRMVDAVGPYYAEYEE